MTRKTKGATPRSPAKLRDFVPITACYFVEGLFFSLSATWCTLLSPQFQIAFLPGTRTALRPTKHLRILVCNERLLALSTDPCAPTVAKEQKDCSLKVI